MQAVGMSFWTGRRVFITGHTGFMGGWLSFWLARKGARIDGYALAPPTRPSFFETAGLAASVRSREADVRDLATLARAMQEARPEIVFHLAAQPLVRAAHAGPVETFAVNTMGTVHVLEALRQVPSVAAAVIVTTDKVYDNREWPWGYREHDRLGAHEPYGGSKAAAEIAVESYRRAYFDTGAERRLGLATVRAGNVIGGGDWAADRLVPDAVRAFGAGRPLELRRPGSVRPWQHVLDPLQGFLMLAERLCETPDDWSGAWNFGPDEREACTADALAREIAALWGDGATVAHGPDGGPAEAGLLMLSSAQAKARLGWRPRWSLSRALAETVAWYKAHIAHAAMADVTERQIALFEGAN
jgi:CDP-glucose 4,6-dehydratase